MNRRVIQILVFLFCISFLFTGCAKKEVKVVPPSSSMSKGRSGVVSPPSMKQEDLTTKKGGMEGEGLAQAKVGQYNISQPQEFHNGTSAKKIPLTKEDEKILHERIHFAFDSYELSPKAREILKKKAEVLLKYPYIKMVIEGNCDERGTEEYNLALGERRARAAYEYLILLGIEADRLSIVSYGEERPLDPRHNEEAWAKNRRDDFTIIK